MAHVVDHFKAFCFSSDDDGGSRAADTVFRIPAPTDVLPQQVLAEINVVPIYKGGRRTRT